MEIMEFLIKILALKLKMFGEALDALNSVNQARDAAERNRHLRKLGGNLVIVGWFIASLMVAIVFYFYQLKKLSALYFMILCCLVLTVGMGGIFVGWFVINTNDPGNYINFAKVTLFTCIVAAVFAMGLCVAAFFSFSSVDR